MLYVGNRSRGYKNWAMLLDAMAGLPTELALLCFGPPPTAEERALVEARALGDRVVFTGGDDARLATAYTSATVLAYPSRYEGFGLPPLEAMAHGCPVVAGRGGSLSEVLGDAAWLVADDVDELAHALAEVVTGGVDAERLREAGPLHAAGYTWDRTVRRPSRAIGPRWARARPRQPGPPASLALYCQPDRRRSRARSRSASRPLRPGRRRAGTEGADVEIRHQLTRSAA